MDYSWDERKRRANIRKHDVDFKAVERFDWETALIEIDDREDYGELREVAYGFIGELLHSLVFTQRDERIHVISLRKATRQERRDYARQIG